MLNRTTLLLRKSVLRCRYFGSAKKDHHDEHHAEHHAEHDDHHDHHHEKSHADKRHSAIIGTRLDPRKHIYMHHGAQQQYDDHWAVGEFPQPDRVAQSEPSGVYKLQAVDSVFAHLRKTVKGFNLTGADYKEIEHQSWQLHGVYNIDEIKYTLMDILADSIVVKESKYRPKIEQRLRKSFTRDQLGVYVHSEKSIGDFFNGYNTCLWLLKQQSNMFRSQDIPGEKSALEIEATRKENYVGVADLNLKITENNNLINKVMRALHN